MTLVCQQKVLTKFPMMMTECPWVWGHSARCEAKMQAVMPRPFLSTMESTDMPGINHLR